MLNFPLTYPATGHAAYRVGLDASGAGAITPIEEKRGYIPKDIAKNLEAFGKALDENNLPKKLEEMAKGVEMITEKLRKGEDISRGEREFLSDSLQGISSALPLARAANTYGWQTRGGSFKEDLKPFFAAGLPNSSEWGNLTQGEAEVVSGWFGGSGSRLFGLGQKIEQAEIAQLSYQMQQDEQVSKQGKM
jgi:hypothetical protein